MFREEKNRLALECLKIAASIHTSSIDMALIGAERMYKWLIEKSNDTNDTKDVNDTTTQINS